MTARRILMSSAVALLLFAASAAADKNDKPNPVFAGRIMLSDKRFPASAKSLAAFNAQINKQSKTSFFEDKDKKWKIYFAGFLKAPLNDVEYVVKLYELTGKGQQLLATIEQFTDSRGQSSLVSYINLDRKTMGANKEMQMTIENHGKVLASSRFKLLGQQEKFTGKVDFSEDEANGKKRDDDE
jgi:hypothetical protein